MKVKNMTSDRTNNEVANQFDIVDDQGNIYFQSYDSVIVKIHGSNTINPGQVYLDTHKWDFSKTTGKYRNQFLGETKKETQAKIDSGEYILADLN